MLQHAFGFGLGLSAILRHFYSWLPLATTSCETRVFRISVLLFTITSFHGGVIRVNFLECVYCVLVFSFRQVGKFTLVRNELFKFFNPLTILS